MSISARCYRFTTPNAADAVKLSRDHVTLLLNHTGCQVETDTATLLVSEVVTNAHQHTTSPLVALTTTIRPGCLRIDVYDTSPIPLPIPTAPAPALSEQGRGVLLLQSLATHWGWHLDGAPKPHGKTVWFELSSPSLPLKSTGS